MKIKAKDLKIGAIYQVRSRRKGSFRVRVDAVHGEWIEGTITEGQASAITDGNERETGESVTLRDCLTDFFEVPSAIRGANIPRTGNHDAGAIARCSYCGRYSDNPKALQYDPRSESPKDLRCDCGKTHGWCGSFKRPTAESVWSA